MEGEKTKKIYSMIGFLEIYWPKIKLKKKKKNPTQLDFPKHDMPKCKV